MSAPAVEMPSAEIIRASGDVTDQYEFMIIGSQSILDLAAPRHPGHFTGGRHGGFDVLWHGQRPFEDH